MAAEGHARMIAPGEGEVILQGGVGVVRKIPAAADGAFSVVEHPLEPGALAAPPHTHANVDEYSFVIEGEIEVLMGECSGYPTPSGTQDRRRRGCWRSSRPRASSSTSKNSPRFSSPPRPDSHPTSPG